MWAGDWCGCEGRLMTDSGWQSTISPTSVGVVQCCSTQESTDCTPESRCPGQRSDSSPSPGPSSPSYWPGQQRCNKPTEPNPTRPNRHKRCLQAGHHPGLGVGVAAPGGRRGAAGGRPPHLQPPDQHRARQLNHWYYTYESNEFLKL